MPNNTASTNATNTTDKTTLKDFLAKIEKQYGSAERIWVMDRDIPTEETLALMREANLRCATSSAPQKANSPRWNHPCWKSLGNTSDPAKLWQFYLQLTEVEQAFKETAPLKAILLSSGSELNVALAAAEKLGPAVRVVSVPSFFRFDQQPAAYREEVLPTACRARIAVEAGVDTSWWKYIGLDGKTVAINRFGLTAPGNTLMKELGISPENVVATVQGYVAL